MYCNLILYMCIYIYLKQLCEKGIPPHITDEEFKTLKNEVIIVHLILYSCWAVLLPEFGAIPLSGAETRFQNSEMFLFLLKYQPKYGITLGSLIKL